MPQTNKHRLILTMDSNYTATGIRKKRVDFPNPETQKALKNLIEFFKINFIAAPGNNLEEVAADIIMEAIEKPFFLDGSKLHESIYSRALIITRDYMEERKHVQENEEPTVSESDLEDIYHLIESKNFTGSEKQIKWARDIAHKYHTEIGEALKKNIALPSQAKWWIENRGNISEALK